ncbi:MAG: BLUF domain-containing protein [Lamprobacter sp.]|uniref:BLUF domain-containing protein n=1 Tax=Lamprobacter sp. TaxID=3100796 RepID=UPI002B2575E3|nr:BLUF domain-containing protein [Lamprobacter sp.]MEA3640268.1 BLUF domain-containing protein [Lamprobacter sp.]
MIDLIALLYLSSASESLTEDDVNNILQVSRINNQRCNITGVLCSGGGHFIQVLEGPQKEVLKSYLCILDDPRHTDCLLIGINPLQKRIFGDWAMGHIDVAPEQMLERRQSLIKCLQDQVQKDGPELMRIMRSLIYGSTRSEGD